LTATSRSRLESCALQEDPPAVLADLAGEAVVEETLSVLQGHGILRDLMGDPGD
jgi:hypothetical protein